jgi:putative PIN family toxin of toxin-antitoxin system
VRVVFDTNVIISALLFGGKPKDLLDLGFSGQVEICISPPLIEELVGVLEEKFQAPREWILEAAGVLRANSRLIEPGEEIRAVKDDPMDNRVLECAVAAKADLIVSGDHHLLDLKSCRGIRILGVSEALNRLKAKKG